MCKASQYSEAALVCERCDELRRGLPARFTRSQHSALDQLGIETHHVKRRIKLVCLQMLSSYGVFVVKSDTFAVDIENKCAELNSIMETFTGVINHFSNDKT